MELRGIDEHVVVKSNEQDDWPIILLIALYVFGISSLVKITPSVDLGIAINKFGLATEVIHSGQSEGVMFSTTRGGASCLARLSEFTDYEGSFWCPLNFRPIALKHFKNRFPSHIHQRFG